MLRSGANFNFILILSTLYIVVIVATDFFHQAPEQHKLTTGWQEPGLWRPKWIMYRSFEAVPTDSGNSDKQPGKVYRDKICFRMKNDRTLKLYNTKNRPFLEIMKPPIASEKKSKLFETGDEEVLSIKEKWEKSMAESELEEENDGTWWFQDAAPLNQGIVKIETREGEDAERIRHDIRCEWGTLDGYAAKFRTGKILKYKMTDAGVPLGTYPVGTFTIRVSPHRPLVSKEFIAFE